MNRQQTLSNKIPITPNATEPKKTFSNHRFSSTKIKNKKKG